MTAHTYLRKLGLALLLAAAVVALPARAGAQQLEKPRQRQGYWVQFGYHLMLSETWEEGNHLGPWFGNLMTIRMGQLLTERFGLGFTFDMGGASGKAGKEWNEVNHIEVFYGIGLEAQYNPWRNLGIHAGAGMGIVELMATEGSDQSLRGNYGTAWMLGASYDFFPLKKKLTGGFCITPMFQLRYTPGVKVDHLMGLVGVQIGLWTGMPRNQLELDENEAYKK